MGVWEGSRSIRAVHHGSRGIRAIGRGSAHYYPSLRKVSYRANTDFDEGYARSFDLYSYRGDSGLFMRVGLNTLRAYVALTCDRDVEVGYSTVGAGRVIPSGSEVSPSPKHSSRNTGIMSFALYSVHA